MRRLITALFVTFALSSAQAATQMEELAQRMHPSDFPAQVEKLLKNDNPAQALELTELGLQKNEKSAQLHFMKAVSLEQLGRTDEAVKVLRHLIGIYPEIPESYNNLAVIEAGLGRLEDAVDLLNRALTINPDFALARKNLGDVYLALAREAYEKAAPKLPRNKSLQKRLKALQTLEGRPVNDAK